VQINQSMIINLEQLALYQNWNTNNYYNEFCLALTDTLVRTNAKRKQ